MERFPLREWSGRTAPHAQSHRSILFSFVWGEYNQSGVRPGKRPHRAPLVLKHHLYYTASPLVEESKQCTVQSTVQYRIVQVDKYTYPTPTFTVRIHRSHSQHTKHHQHIKHNTIAMRQSEAKWSKGTHEKEKKDICIYRGEISYSQGGITALQSKKTKFWILCYANK
jgi:hypothetical protein